MKLKKTLAAILTVLISVSALSVADVISFADTEGIYTYTVSGDSAAITRINYNGIKELTIPETLGGYPVTAIYGIGNTYSFGSANMVEKLIIPSFVTSVGYDALRTFDCAKVEVDENNPNYSSDEYGVLFNKDKTLLIGCPCSLQQTEYVFPETVKEIGYLAFEKCAFIEKIVLPEGIESLGNQSFCQMPKLREINIPEGITELGQNMFIQCRSLESIDLPLTLKKVSNSSLSETPIKRVSVPEGVTSIETYAFEACRLLSYVELPKSLKSLHTDVFRNCDSLDYIFYRGSREEWAEIDINNSNDDELERIKVIFDFNPEEGYPGIDYEYADGLFTLTGTGSTPQFEPGYFRYWDEYAQDCDVMIIDGSVTGIGAYSFENFTALEYLIVYPDSITLSENAFSGCTSLDSVIITGAADFTKASFNAPDGAKIYADAQKNPGAADSGAILFAYNDGVLSFTGGVDFDLYQLFDFVSAVTGRYGEIRKIEFDRMTLSGIDLYYISGYINNEPLIDRIADGTLINGELTAEDLRGRAITFNDIIDMIELGDADGFKLVVSDENHKTIIDSNVEIEAPTEPDEPETPVVISTPSEPVTPETPVNPETPFSPVEPEEPATSSAPSQPESPTSAGEPEKPDTLATLSDPMNSATQSEPESPASASEPGDEEEPEGIELVFQNIVNTVVRAIKWAVTLLNKLFKLINKK